MIEFILVVMTENVQQVSVLSVFGIRKWGGEKTNYRNLLASFPPVLLCAYEISLFAVYGFIWKYWRKKKAAKKDFIKMHWIKMN